MNISEEEKEKIQIEKKYIESLSDKERIGIEIAKKQLGSSFCLERSLGYLNYVKKLKEKQLT